MCSVFDVGAESLVSLWVERGTIVFPQSSDVPVIMVGPGTGCAPFRSFIHDRTSQHIPGHSLSLHGLHFNCFCILLLNSAGDKLYHTVKTQCGNQRSVCRVFDKMRYQHTTSVRHK